MAVRKKLKLSEKKFKNISLGSERKGKINNVKMKGVRKKKWLGGQRSEALKNC